MRTKCRTCQVLGFALVAVIGSLVMGSSSCDCDPSPGGKEGDVCDNDGECVSLGLGDCRHLFCETYARGGGVCTAGDRPDGTACNRTQDAMHECQAGACVPSDPGGTDGGTGTLNSCPELDDEPDVDNVPDFNTLLLKDGPRPGPGTPVPNPPDEEANYLTDGDFEDEKVFAGGVPTGTGYWGFDQTWSAPSGQQGINAQSGSRMLHFVGTSNSGENLDVGSASEQSQLVDVSALRGQIDARRVQVEASAYFNRVAAVGESCLIDNSFGIQLGAFDGPVSDFPVSLNTPLVDTVRTVVSTNDDPSDWHPGTVMLTLPPDTDYVAVWIWAQEDGFNDAGYPEFHGHYADDVRLTVRLLP